MFDIPNGEKIPQDLRRFFQDIKSSRYYLDRRRSLELRASAFPICSRAYHIYRRTPIHKRPAEEAAFDRALRATAAARLGVDVSVMKERTDG